MRQGNLG